MDFQELKFEFDVDLMDSYCLDDIFKKVGSWLNMRLDENSEPYIFNDSEEIYEFSDVSHLNPDKIENIVNSFFDFAFDDIVNVPLYKFLVLKKDDNRLTVLANIHSSIFDYTSINKFYDLFNNPNSNALENNILDYYNYVDNYLASSDFENDSIYWKNHFLDIGNHVKYYNFKSDNYKNIRIPINNDLISDFLKDHDVCEFEFVTAVFALYLARVDRTKGSILKTMMPKDNLDFGLFDISTLLKIPFIPDCSFTDYLNEIKNVYNESVEHSKVDIGNYVDDVLSYYGVYDFTKLENVNIFNGDGSALTLNIYGDYLDLLYNVELFSDVYMKHMAGNINHLINEVIASPNQILNRVDILSDMDKDLLLDFCKGNSVDVDKNKTFASAFRENAIKYPDFMAVDDGVNQVTYAELEKSSNSVAYDLKYNYDVDFGDCVGLMIPRNYHFPELVCALNKIGAVFTPIDPNYPLKRIEHMLNISEARYIVTTKEYADNFSFNVDVIYIEDLNMDHDVSVECLGSGDDLLAIFFTSGTTGLPKAVMVSNKEISGGAAAFKDIFKSNPGDVTGSFASFSFIASLRLIGALIFGECCRIFNEIEQKDSLLLVKALKEQEMCDLILPPSIGVPILENEDIKLKHLILAGAKLNELTNAKSNTRLVNFYGTTELIFAIANIYDLNNISDDRIPIGRPVANNWVYILDDNGMQMPIGVPGEICISNDFLSPGYYNRPDLTSQVFVDNPYCNCEENRRMYHTGDIGFFNFDGEIEILGREDDQLSVRGFRIESGEILNVMKSFNDMGDVYLDVDNDTLTAYYTAADDLDINSVKDSLNSELPYYMVPSLFIKLDEIPLNANGKIDKGTLNDIVHKSVDVDISDDVLSVVLDAFRDVLGNDSVLLDDDFVELGGTSLSAMNLQRILKDKFGVALSSSEIIDLASPIDIANHIKYNLKVHSSEDIVYSFDDEAVPLLESQLNVYLDEKVKDMGTGYNNPFKIQFNKKYTLDEVENAIMTLCECYPILNARVIEDENDISFIFDVKPLVSCGLMGDVDDFVKPFDLNESLARFLFIEDKSLLCVDFHHLIIDGTSLNIIINSLLELLDGKKLDFIDDGFLKQVSMERNLDSDYMKNASEFFDKMLVDLNETYDLPESVKLDNNESNEYIVHFDIEENSLNSFIYGNSVTPNQFFCSVFAYTLSRFAGSSEISFNLIEDGRGHIDLSRSVGMFVRTLPLLVDCKNQEVGSFIKYCATLINTAMNHDLYPFRLLAKDYSLNSSISFQYSHVLFSNMLRKDSSYCVEELGHDVNGDLTFFIFNCDDDELGIKVLYSDKFSSTFIERFVESYKLILFGMLKFNQLSDIDYISNSDILLLDEINETEHDLKYGDILDAFNDNLAKYPNNSLVSFNDICYSYGEGAFIANCIAKCLTDLGVEVDDCVGFLLPRSELYMFAVLGIMSKGAVYVPLDDNLPDESMRFMLGDTKSKVVIVSDETYNRARNLSEEIKLLNISDIIEGDVGSSSNLDVAYGDLACILYTSGTTGVPKGVKITRKSVLNLSQSFCDIYDFSRDDVYALYSNIGFDAGPQAILQTIYAGARLTVIPEDIKFNIPKLNEYFIEQNVTHTFISTQVGKLFMEQIENTSLRILSVGGEKLGEFESPKDYLLIDEYGPTEAFAYVSSIDNNDKVDESSVGMLNHNTKAYILDNECRRIPVGAVGELCLAGYQLADGYLNRIEENTKVFMNNPFDDMEDYNVLYRTGDMVRLLPDGSLGIVGRRDDQVKIRGNRVELTEIESLIRNMENIEDVTVQTITNNENNELIAYVVLSEGSKIDNVVDYVRRYVSEHKPEYMVPSYVLELDTIPLNVNGKVDKSALPDVDVSSLQAEYAAPTNETEKHIIDAFELVFNQKGLGLNDDFVRLGGDSITAIRVVSLLEKNGINCTARGILNYKTPYLIAQNVENVESISYDAVEGPVDLLPIQNYFFDQINADDFSQFFILKSKEKLDINTLQESFDELCNVHDMLRAKYSYDKNGKAIQEILPVNTRICEINEQNISENLEESLKEIYIKSSNSLSIQDNLIEINLIHHNNESYLMFIIHHLIIDGVSWNILITDLTNIYTNLKQGKEVELTRPYPYKEWIDDVDQLVNNISPGEKEHWTKLNRQIDDSAIKGDSKAFAFDVDVNYDAGNLLMLSEEEYWALAIAKAYKKTYEKELIFNRESHGRDDSIAKLNRTIGWFTSQYPILININNKNDDISIMDDVYSIKTALRGTDNLGLNYSSLIYITKELEFKHCPVTFNFLSNEFTFKNELFELYIPKSTLDDEEINIKQDSTSYGITFNIVRNADSYMISGDYANNTYLGDEFNSFIENIKSELEFIGNYEFNDNNVVCCLSESQLGVYLDEKVYEKDTAYSAPGIFEYDAKYTIDEVKDAIHALIKKHPILKGRILDTDNIPLLICDSSPTIEIVNTADYSNLIKQFNLDESLARFYILDNEGKVFYDMHHIISDATSRTIINKELEQALMGELDDDVDWGFVYASRDSFESHYDNRYKSAQEFFRDEFADIDEVQPLLSDIGGDEGSVSLPIRGIRDDIEAFAENIGIGVGSLLNAVFAYTYSRFTGSDKVYYNFIEHGRHEDYSQNAIGMFVRTIPIIAKCENKFIKGYLTDMSDLIINSMTNSIYPFRLIAREFNLNNDVAFEYNQDLNDFDIGDDLVVSDYADSISDFLCVVNDLEDGFVVTVSHLDKFSQHTAKQFVKVFKEVLVQLLEKEKLEDINYISNEDLNLLDAYNKTQHQLKYDDILDAFNDNLAKYPKNSLVTHKNKSYTYDEAAFIANKLANNLKDMGINKGDYVAFLVERSELYMFSILGILSVGATYVPLDEALPDERVKFMIEDTDAKVVIVCDETYNRAKNLSDEINLLNISDIIEDDVGNSSNLDVDYGDLACILYTSGTTGIPKGVKITRKSVLNLSQSYCDTYGFSQDDVCALYSNIGFDAGSKAILRTIYAGACLTVIPDDIKFNISKLNEYFIEQNVTHTFISTQVGKLFMEQIDNTPLKILLVGGEKLGEFESPKDYRLIDGYGPTETFAFISSIDNNNKLDGTSVGILNHNTKAYILDNDSRRVPIGAVGELYLTGYQVSEGYLNRPEETNKAFLVNPFNDGEGYERMYRTGDMVRVLSDGSLAIVGRRDSQVKIRGNRLELMEVESVIREIGYVDDVTVQTIKHETNNELVAYVVVTNALDGNDLKDSICDYVNERKPEFMVPSFVIRLDEIPLNVNGKVDKHALPDVDRDTLHGEYVAPRDENEKAIVEAFEKALGLENVGIYDDFIRLGGDSLTAIKLLSYIESNDITMADIFAFRTPEAIAKNMSGYSFDLDLYSLESGCPLNSSQINVFADVVGYNKKTAYQIPGHIPIPNEYGIEKILDSLDELLNVHPILSMRLSDIYEVNDANDVSNLDVLRDLIATAKKFGIKELMNIVKDYGLDVGGLYNVLKTLIRLFKGEYPYLIKGDKPPISVESNADEDTVLDFFSETLDIYGNLAKFMVVELDGSYYLLYLIHHLIFDATSAGVFAHDFKTILDGGSLELDDVFLKASALTHQIKNTEKFDEAAEFFEHILSDLDDVGKLTEENSSEGFTTSTHNLEFDKDAFKSFLNKSRISENALFTGVFAYTLSQFVERDKVLFTAVENGRDRFSENFIGMTTNVMPMVVDCKDQSIDSYMEDVADLVYGVSRHSYYPLLLIYQKSNFEANVVFQFIPNWIADDFIDFSDIYSMDISKRILNNFNDSIAEFFVQVCQSEDGYILVFTNSNKYSDKLVNDFKDTFVSILSNIIKADLSSELSKALK